MSTAAISLGPTMLCAKDSAWAGTHQLLAVTTAIVIGLAFFVASHDFRVSLAESYTQDAEQMEIAAAGGNSLRRVAFVGLAGWGCVLLAAGRGRINADPLLAVSIGLLLALTAASFVWADEAGMCLRRLLTFICCVVAAVGTARVLTLREICWLTVGVLGSLAVVGVLVELALGTFRPWAADYRFAGTVHPNTQGPALAMFCLAAFGLARAGSRGSVWLWIALAVAMGLLLLTKSRTTTAAIVLALAAVQFRKMPLPTKLIGVAAMAWLGGLSLWMLWVCGIDPLHDFRDALLLGRAEESDTLSGRAFIWPEVFSFIQERLWLGYGYESFWTAGRIENISSTLGWGLREAHNAYLETLLSLGIVGLATLLLVCAVGFWSALRDWRKTDDSAHALPAGMIVFAMINAGFESGMVAISLVPFLLGCSLLRLAFFRELEGAKR